MNTLFFGTPALAVPFLELLHGKSRVRLVVTNPDQPAGRGYVLRPSPVKEAAERLALSLAQPAKASDPGFLEHVRQLPPDVGIVVAYGKLLPASLLKIPKLGFLNVHFSLLPAYRGAAPIQWALINGERETGVTLFWLDEGMDTGPVFMQERVAIGDDDAESLRGKLVTVGVRLLEQGLERLAKEGRVETPQTGQASRAPILQKEDGRIDWNKPSGSIVHRIRGVTPWPGAYVELSDGEKKLRLKILEAAAVTGTESGSPGSVVRLESGRGFVVKCLDGNLQILKVQPEGKKPMSAWDYWQGARMQIGDLLG